MTSKSYARTPSPKTVTFDKTISYNYNTPYQRHHFKNHVEWERYLNALLADLQNTIRPSHNTVSSHSSDYGSLNNPSKVNNYQKYEGYQASVGTYGKTQPPASSRSISSIQAQPPQSHGGGYGSQNSSQVIYGSQNSSQVSGYGSQNSSQVGYGSHNSTQGGGYGSQNSGQAGGAGTEKRFNNNLSELDTLLHDLSNAKYANTAETFNGSMNGGTYNGSGGRSPSATYSRPSSAQSTLNRPTVDSLLDELNAGEVIYTGPKKVIITVKETKTETGYPGETELVSTHVSSTSKAPAASTATRELDDLMATLSDFKVTSDNLQHQTVTDSQYARPSKATPLQAAPPQKQNLDSMLGNLQADMSRQGVNTSQKGCCGACEKPIVGQVITALGKTWHPEHFTCAHCSQELGTRNFFERDGKPYCEPDYHNLFSPRCAYCNGPILDKCVTALEKTWHMEHFFCAQCGKQFGEEGFHEREGKPYCRDDYFDMFAPKCGACNRSIMENYISALNSQWHPDCFVCRDCKLAVQGKSFYAVEGKPVCPQCIGVGEEEEEED